MTQLLDPVAILSYLNGLGYYNITPQQLKEFMKDLKKLIKYEDQQKKESHKLFAIEKSTKLFQTQTFSSKAKISKNTKNNEIRLRISSPNKPQREAESRVFRPTVTVFSEERFDPVCAKPIVRACQSAPVPKKGDLLRKGPSLTTKNSQSKKSSNSGTISRTDTDPVALYHRYKKEWDRRKIPGENDHAELSSQLVMVKRLAKWTKIPSKVVIL